MKLIFRCETFESVCNGVSDCADNSDEARCSSLCCDRYQIGDETYHRVASSSVRDTWVSGSGIWVKIVLRFYF